MKFSLLLFALLLAACAVAPNQSPKSQSPFDQEIIADRRLPHNEDELSELLLTLPVWDISPERILPWISEHGSRSGDTLSVLGDGAQDSLQLRRLAQADQYELRIGSEGWPEGGLSYYTLQRLPNGWPTGWRVLTRR